METIMSVDRTGMDFADYNNYVAQGGRINGAYLKDGTTTKAKTNFFYSNSIAPTTVEPTQGAVWLDWDAKKLYVGSNVLKAGDSGSWVALV